MKKYNKLIRDKIPQIIESNGQIFSSHIAEDDEYLSALKNKVFEEVEEFFQDPSSEEMADILEVLSAISKYYDLETSEIKRVREEKNKKRGRFQKRIILETVG